MAKITLTVTVDLEETLTERELDHLVHDLEFDLKSVARFSQALHAKQGVTVSTRVVPAATWGAPISPLSI
jgi:hypothetical protein